MRIQTRYGFVAAAGAALLAASSPAWSAAARTVDEHRAADPQGTVEISNVEGTVEVSGWDKPEVAVTGTLGPNVERLDVTTSGTRTVVHVVSHESKGLHFGWSSDGGDGAKLVVRVPQRSNLSASLVSADINVSGVSGNEEIQTVSGDVRASAQREVRIRTVSGDVRLTAGTDARILELSTVSGDVSATGGGGDVSVHTISGDGTLKLGSVTRGRIKTVSGDFNVSMALAADGQLEGESVSGDFRLTFDGGMPPAEVDLQSFSGDLSTCQKSWSPARSGYGPGSRLNFREGAGTARIRVNTQSGDVTLCGK